MKHLLFPLFIVTPSTILATTFTDESDKFGLAGGNDACWFDFNNDGFVDICAGGKVFRNEKGQKFVYVADVGSSVAADFDNDGYLDRQEWADALSSRRMLVSRSQLLGRLTLELDMVRMSLKVINFVFYFIAFLLALRRITLRERGTGDGVPSVFVVTVIQKRNVVYVTFTANDNTFRIRNGYV